MGLLKKTQRTLRLCFGQLCLPNRRVILWSRLSHSSPQMAEAVRMGVTRHSYARFRRIPIVIPADHLTISELKISEA